jgi:hypothetical protein
MRCGSLQTLRGGGGGGIKRKCRFTSSRRLQSQEKRSTGCKDLLFRSKQSRHARAGDRSNKVLLTLSRGEGRCDVTGTANHWQSIPDLSPALAPCEPIACHCPGPLLICLGSPSNAAGATRVGPCCPSRDAQTAGATVIDKRREHRNCSVPPPPTSAPADLHAQSCVQSQQNCPAPVSEAHRLSRDCLCFRRIVTINFKTLPMPQKYFIAPPS